MTKSRECEVIFGIDTLAGWMNVSSYKVRKFISAGMPCAKIDDDGGRTQWIFHLGAVNEWFYKKTFDTRPKDPNEAS